MQNPTYDEIDKAFDGLNSSEQIENAPGIRGLNPQEILVKICPIYQAVRPFLIAISNLPFIPQKWRAGLQLFISAMDQICP